MINQQKLLPGFKEQTRVMQALVQQGHILDIHRIAKEHIKTVIEIDDYTYNVEIIVKDLIQIVENDNYDGMKNAINELKEQTAYDQYKAIIVGGLKVAGGAGGAIGGGALGIVAIKLGFAIVSITAIPITPLFVVGVIGVSAFAALESLNNYNDAENYKEYLNIVETNRANLHIALKNLEKNNQ